MNYEWILRRFHRFLITIITFIKNEWRTFLSLAIGAILTWFFSYLYYVKAGDELHFEANRLREETAEINRLTNIVLRGLHNGDIIKVKYNKDGKVIGLVINLKETKVKVESNASNAELDIDSKVDSKTGQ